MRCLTKPGGHFLHIGFGNTVVANRMVTILQPDSAPLKRLRDRAADRDMLIDATKGRRTRAIIIMDSNHIVLSGVHAETLLERANKLQEAGHEQGLD
jgi:regulator of extracellular matrix RemA (YlzA/DUF370 family)